MCWAVTGLACWLWPVRTMGVPGWSFPGRRLRRCRPRQLSGQSAPSLAPGWRFFLPRSRRDFSAVVSACQQTTHNKQQTTNNKTNNKQQTAQPPSPRGLGAGEGPSHSATLALHAARPGPRPSGWRVRRVGAAAKQHLFLNLSFAHLTGGALAPGSPRARAPTRTAQQEWAIAARHFNGGGAATAARCRTWTSTRRSSWPRCCSRQRRLPPPPPSESLLNGTGLVEGLVMEWLPQCSQVLSAKEQKMALATKRVKMASPLQE